MQLSKKQKTFSQFFAVFLKSTSNVEHFEKNMSLIGTYSRNYRLRNTC